MFEKLTRSIVCSLIILVMAPLSASAHEMKETFWILTNSWKIFETQNKSVTPSTTTSLKAKSLSVSYPNFTVEVQGGGKQRKYPVNMFLLAHNTNTAKVGAVSYQLAMTDYLKGLKALSNADALIRLGNLKQNEPLEVVGIWQFDSQDAWNRAITQGSQIMNLSAPQVKKFGSANAYKAELIKRTQLQWTQIDSRKAK